MNTTLLLVFILLIGGVVKGQNWTQLDNLPGAERDDGAVFVIDDKAYFGTGLPPWWTPLGDFYEFNMTSETWIQVSSLPLNEERQYAAAFAHNGKGYLFGGYNGVDFLNDFWEYDPIQDSWTELDTLPAVGRSGSSVIVIGDTAYLIGGKTAGSFATDEVWALDLTSGNWQQKQSLQETNWRGSTVELDNMGYLIFGRNNFNEFQNDLYQYNPIVDNWSLVDTFPGQGRSHAAMQRTDDGFLVCFGIDSSGSSYNDLWHYSVSSSIWTPKNSLPSSGRRGGTSFKSSNTFYYTCGINSTDIRLKETWKYDIEMGMAENKLIGIEVFPNPATDFISIRSEQAINEIRLFDASGREIILEPEVASQYKINTQELERGIYLLFVETGSTVQSKKISIR